jgi:hypothetical protein
MLMEMKMHYKFDTLFPTVTKNVILYPVFSNFSHIHVDAEKCYTVISDTHTYTHTHTRTQIYI